MASSAQRRLSTYRAPQNIAWFLGPDGRFLQASGSGMKRKPVGLHFEEAFGDRPDMVKAFRRMLAGHPYSGPVECDGRTLHMEAEPVYVDGELVGVSGLCVVVEEARPESDPAERVVEIQGNHHDHGVWEGDRLLVKPGRGWFAQVRYRPIRDYHLLMLEAPGCAKVTPSPDSSRRLQLVR